MKTLSDLHWFSFAQDLNKIEALTVWQAIGHILSHTPKAEAAFEQYVEDLTQLETDCANDIIDFNDESGRSTLVMIGGEIKAITTEDSGSHKYGLDHIVLPTETIRAELDLLDMNRLTLIESLPQPSLLYRILMGDIDSAEARLSSTLQLVPDEHQIVIKRTSLKAWRDSKQLDALQLIHDDPKAKRRKVREDLKDNQLLVIHVLLRLLEDAAPEQYTKRSNQSKHTTHVSNLYQAMSACAHGHRFPSRRTIDNIVETARARFEDEAISG